MKSSPCFHQYIIHAGTCGLQGYMLSLTVHSVSSIDILQIDYWSIIIWLVISWVNCLEDGGFGVIGAEYMNGPVIKIAAVSIIEKYLWINIVFST